MDWIQSAVMGFVMGLSGPLPMSEDANLALLRYFFGTEPEDALFGLLCRVAILTVVLSAGGLELRRLRRTMKLQSVPKRRRHGNPDLGSAGTLRMLRSAAVLAVAGQLLSVWLGFMTDKLWLMAIPLMIGGLILWIPGLFWTGNKDGRHLTGLDGMCMGLGALAAGIPGLSPAGTVCAVGALLGAERGYTLRFAWILLSVRLGAAAVMDLLKLLRGGIALELNGILCAMLGAVCAAVGTYGAIQFARSRIRTGAAGLNDFCYFNWGLALLMAVLFLLV